MPDSSAELRERAAITSSQREVFQRLIDVQETTGLPKAFVAQICQLHIRLSRLEQDTEHYRADISDKLAEQASWDSDKLQRRIVSDSRAIQSMLERLDSPLRLSLPLRKEEDDA